MRSNKLITKTVLLSVAMAGVITSCQKDEFQSEMVLPSHEMSQKLLAHQELTLRYWIDGVEYSMEFGTEQEKSNYISYLISLTREGKTVIIQGSENPSYAPTESDKLTFTTKNGTDMDAWIIEMEGKGYNVEVTFDKETNLYTGTATKGGSRTMAASLSEERE
ncbi:MAG: hypothetical protein IJ269_03140 [Bacteroidales bacterium]|nr:hypothetical protein [Bacteroidales bacterium]